MLKLLYLPRHSGLVQALTFHQRQPRHLPTAPPSAAPAPLPHTACLPLPQHLPPSRHKMHSPVPTSRPHPFLAEARDTGQKDQQPPSQEQLPEPWGTQPVAWGPTEGVGGQTG